MNNDPNVFLAERMINLASRILLNRVEVKEVEKYIKENFFEVEEKDTKIFLYIYEEPSHHPEGDLIIQLWDCGSKVFLSWQGVKIFLEGNFPNMGYNEEGEFGLGGDWWRG